MQKPEVTAYLKTYCGWSAGVRAVLAKYNLPYTEKDIIQNPAFRWEMETKSGQPLSPCVEINGQHARRRQRRRSRTLSRREQTRRSERCRDRRPDQRGVRERATRRRGKTQLVDVVRRFLETSPRLPRRTPCNSHFAQRAIRFSFAQRNVRLDCLVS